MNERPDVVVDVSSHVYFNESLIMYLGKLLNLIQNPSKYSEGYFSRVTDMFFIRMVSSELSFIYIYNVDNMYCADLLLNNVQRTIISYNNEEVYIYLIPLIDAALLNAAMLEKSISELIKIKKPYSSDLYVRKLRDINKVRTNFSKEIPNLCKNSLSYFMWDIRVRKDNKVFIDYDRYRIVKKLYRKLKEIQELYNNIEEQIFAMLNY